ncbi:MAG: hypothetical protein KME01_15790 [Chroococcus sp. CMT-3BRIN-NPC107]|nr:hypothetical protein [Chroococcus sp. CMT-3BRIN-NPC107]
MSQVKFSLQRLSPSNLLPPNFLKNWKSAAWGVECLFIGSDRLEQKQMTPKQSDDLAYLGSNELNLALRSNRRSRGYRQKIALPI